MESTTDSIRLDDLDGFEFEKLCKRIFEKLGYGRIIDVQDVADEGRDLIIEGYHGNRAVVECKHQPGASIGRPIVQKLHSASLSSQARYALLVTTGRFSKGAIEYAKKLKDVTVNLIDLPLLNDLAQRAGIKLLKSGESSPVEYLSLSEPKTLAENVGKTVLPTLVSFPSAPQALVSITPTQLELRSAYVVRYNIHEDFTTSVGRIHSIHADNQVALIGGTNGEMLDPELTKFIVGSVGKQRTEPEPSGVELRRSNFKLDQQTLTSRAKQHITKVHTNTVSYHGRNNVLYSKVCQPGERSVFISSISQLYYPHWQVSVRAKESNYRLSAVDNQSAVLIASTNLFICKVCGQYIQFDRLLCNSCGAIVHRKSHGFPCEICQKTICRTCTFWTRKWLLLKKKICETCADGLVNKGKLKRRLFEPQSNIS